MLQMIEVQMLLRSSPYCYAAMTIGARLYPHDINLSA